MHLTSFTDYGLRALMQMAGAPDRTFSSAEIANTFNVSRNHLTKIMATLAWGGYVETRRGKNGGAALAIPANEILLGDVIRLLEQGTPLVECFSEGGGNCRISSHCQLKSMLHEAKDEFIESMNRYTLEDCAISPGKLAG